MKRLLILILAALGGAVLAAPVHAQLAPGYSGYSSAPTEGTDKDYWYLIRQLGYCLSDTKKEQSLAILATRPGSPEEGEAWDALFNQRRPNPCMQTFVSATMVRGHVRGSLAEALFLRATKDQPASLSPSLMEPETVSDIYDFADCYVAAHYGEAGRLLSETRIATEGELQFIREIAGDFGPCLPSGAQVAINPVDIRLAIAEALYRTTRAPAQTAAIEGGQ